MGLGFGKVGRAGETSATVQSQQEFSQAPYPPVLSSQTYEEVGDDALEGKSPCMPAALTGQPGPSAKDVCACFLSFLKTEILHLHVALAVLEFSLASPPSSGS